VTIMAISAREFSASLESLAMAVKYYVVVPFDRDALGALRPGEAREATHAWAAERAASFLARDHAGAVAFSRIGDPATGEFQDAMIIAQFGEVDLEALSAWPRPAYS
jgi:hypothetical protein